MTIDKNLIVRLVTGIIFLAIMIGCIIAGYITSTLLFISLAAACTIELTGLFHKKLGFTRFKNLLVFLHIALLVLILLTFWFTFNFTLILVVFLGGVLTISMMLLLLENEMGARVKLALFNGFALVYTFFPFLCFSLLSWYTQTRHSPHPFLFFFVLIWTNDTFAYVCGRLMGKTKLAEKISPKKTIEGFVGGMVLTYVAAWAYNVYVPMFSTVECLAMGVLISVFATLGDLFESALKRWLGVKDSGNILPGHGGFLDRFDGALVAFWPYMLATLVFNI